MKAISILLEERPQVLTRITVQGKPMLRILNCTFEQAIRDTVKAYGDDVLETECKVELYCALCDLPPIGVGKSVLDGLNKYAYKDDRLVKQLVIVDDREVKGCHIRLSSINGEEPVREFVVPANPVAKREAFSQIYTSRLPEDEILSKRLDRTSELIKKQISGLKDGPLSIQMRFRTDVTNCDIDNIAKYYLMAMEKAAAIKLHSIVSLDITLIISRHMGVEIDITNMDEGTITPYKTGVNRVWGGGKYTDTILGS